MPNSHAQHLPGRVAARQCRGVLRKKTMHTGLFSAGTAAFRVPCSLLSQVIISSTDEVNVGVPHCGRLFRQQARSGVSGDIPEMGEPPLPGCPR